MVTPLGASTRTRPPSRAAKAAVSTRRQPNGGAGRRAVAFMFLHRDRHGRPRRGLV